MIGNAMIDPLDDALVSAVGAAEDLRAGLAAAVRGLRRDYPVEGVQWCTRGAEDAALWVELSCGESSGPRVSVSVGAAGTIVLIGEQAGQAEAAVAGLRPLLHHWWTAEQLAEHVSRLARSNQALEDFAALVAHDLKASLIAASRTDPPGINLSRALDIVDSILEAARADGATGGVALLPDVVREAAADLGDIRAEIITSVTGHMPIPAAALRFVLRNLLANAVAAGARTIHVSALVRGDRHVLAVTDNGVGLGSTGEYGSGSQLGVALCRRLLARFGGSLVLKRRSSIGTRAVIVLKGPAQ